MGNRCFIGAKNKISADATQELKVLKSFRCSRVFPLSETLFSKWNCGFLIQYFIQKTQLLTKSVHQGGGELFLSLGEK